MSDGKHTPKIGDTRVYVETLEGRECQECGERADYRISFLLEGFRSDPASSAYGKDDCTWCSDLDFYACEAHKSQAAGEAPIGFDRGASIWSIKKFPHFGVEWVRREAPDPQTRLAEAEKQRDELLEVAKEYAYECKSQLNRLPLSRQTERAYWQELMAKAQTAIAKCEVEK